jgi:hypothetical protein
MPILIFFIMMDVSVVPGHVREMGACANQSRPSHPVKREPLAPGYMPVRIIKRDSAHPLLISEKIDDGSKG